MNDENDNGGGRGMGTGKFPNVLIDTNYWKSFIHARLATTPGDRGALTLYGTKRTNHALFAQHVAGSETSTLTRGHAHDVREWRLKPLRPDNHWLDCLVGCAVAASIQGVALGGVHQPLGLIKYSARHCKSITA